MKKVLQITNYMYPHIGGIEQVTRDISGAIKGKYEQKIICFNHEKGTNYDSVDGVPVVRVNCQAKVSSQSIALSYNKELKKILSDFRPDIVVFHYPNPFAAHFLMKHLKKKNFSFILYWHLDIIKQRLIGKLFKRQNLALLKYADKIVATSPNYIDGSPWLSLNKEKCISIPCCINDERLKYDEKHIEKANSILNEHKNKKICFAFGRHVEYKGLSYLIRASKYLSDEFIILIGGCGPLTNKLIDEAKNDKKIFFLGKISDDELKSCLLACDVFCFPSITKNEAFGIGLAEAMYYGKPAVTFSISGSGVNFVNLDKITGLEVENGNFIEYANAMSSICENAMLRETLAFNAEQRAKNEFNKEIFADRILDLLIEL